MYFPTTSNTPTEGTDTVTVILPKNFSALSGRILTYEQFELVTIYIQNVEDVPLRFTADGYIEIALLLSQYKNCKHYVYALPEDIESGPVSSINNGENQNLRQIVSNYLDEHKDLNVSIDQFN